jgi:uncharacterized repeat protein (TIGR03806 family)
VRLAALAAVTLLAGCARHPCVQDGDRGYLDNPYATLSEYCLVSIQDGGIHFAPGVVPYDLNDPLFSDDAIKVRGVWIPGDAGAATYDDKLALAFPPGTILVKSFGFAADLRDPGSHVSWAETRVLINGTNGWDGFTYVWNEEGTDATLLYAGDVRPLSFIDRDGGTTYSSYLIPSHAQCKQCHDALGAFTPIGPKARQLNRELDYGDGPENELDHWQRVGILDRPSDAGPAPKLIAWRDPDAGTVEQRARAYLEGNCAHCHNASGSARTTGLFLWADEAAPTKYGICKSPVAAGPATGGFQFDVVPGDSEHSILVHRMASVIPDVMMPQIGRSIVDPDGLALVSAWIDGLDGGCP